MADGIINVYKEQGYTSHDVVAKMRGILKQKKIGHTGTLDPMAEGVLPVCVGKGTKLCDMMADKTKTYRAVLLLGQETDTQDTMGKVLAAYPVTVTEEEVREAVLSFLGDYGQIPPMYSALKVGGKKLYELARAGKEVEREARPVTILDIKVEEIALPRAVITVSCSKGTYIRTLCYDIGRKLGCGGCMESLVRTRVAGFFIEDSLKLSDIERLRDEGGLEEYIAPVDSVFKEYPAVMMKQEFDRLVHNGNPFYKDQTAGWRKDGETAKGYDGGAAKGYDGGPARVYDSEGQFMGIWESAPGGRPDFEIASDVEEAPSQGRLLMKPRKVFLGGN